MRNCRIISAEQLLDVVEGPLTDEEVDDLMLTDIVAMAEVDRVLTHLVVEVASRAHEQDVMQAARRAEHLRKAGLPALAFVICEAIDPQAAECAGRENVRVIVEARSLPQADEA